MNSLKYIDVHSHIQDKAFEVDREAVLARMREEGIGALVVGTDRKMSEDAIRLAEQYEFLWATVGQHPTDSLKAVCGGEGRESGINAEFDYDFYLKLAKNPKVVAIGECGLDYYHEDQNAKRKTQRDLFERHIELSLEIKKPLMLHCRPSPGTLDAYEDMLKILDHRLYGHSDFMDFSASDPRYPGNVHFFAGNWDIAERFLKKGFTLSFTGVITFARDYDQVIKNTPLEQLMVETDCPYVAPAPFRGKRNEPRFIKEIANKIAEIRGEDIAKVAKVTCQNALRLFTPSVTI